MQGAAYVEFDVHLSKDDVPIIYHDLTCCISTKTVNEPPTASFVSAARTSYATVLYFLKRIFVVSGSQKNDKTARELIEVPVKDLTFDQLQLLKVKDEKRENLTNKTQRDAIRHCRFAASVSST